MPRYWIGADIGGTFTDIVVLDRELDRLQVTKVPTTPGNLSHGVIQGITSLVSEVGEIDFFVHGTTAGLNALLTRTGARTALITTAGFRDVYEIGRGNRPEMYNLHYRRPKRLVPRRHIFEVAERMRFDGSIEQPLDEAQLASVVDQIAAGDFESVAVCLLHAYANPAHEARIAEVLAERTPGLAVTLSHRIAPEWREFERTSTTVLNAFIAPIIDQYLTDLEARAADSGIDTPIFVMQSSGGILPANAARTLPIQTLMSGPVGGAMGGAALAEMLGRSNLLCVDMGGTSFDMSLVIDGEPEVRTEAEFEGFPALMPMVDIHTIGAGGGSMVWIEAGALRVGPQSAGAFPGPVCYGRGGTTPTVTDANLLLGRIDPATFLGGEMTLDVAKTEAAMGEVGERLGLNEIELSEGICSIINSVMSGAIRRITIERGIDPADFAMVAFGGAGPMHALFIAQELEIAEVIVPHAPGAFSAQGMLQADLQREFVRAFYHPAASEPVEALAAVFTEFEAEAERKLKDDRLDTADLRFVRRVDVRYVGQEHSLTLTLDEIPASDVGAAIADAFHRAHFERFGHSNPIEHVELIALRLTGIIPIPRATRSAGLADGESRVAVPMLRRPVVFDGEWVDAPVYARSELVPGDRFEGPAIVEEPSCTIVVPPAYTSFVDGFENLIFTARQTSAAD
jgi:N-methylhydantoinase A